MSERIAKIIRKAYPKHLLESMKKKYKTFSLKEKTDFNQDMKKVVSMKKDIQT
jgi:hypothetical protein